MKDEEAESDAGGLDWDLTQLPRKRKRIFPTLALSLMSVADAYDDFLLGSRIVLKGLEEKGLDAKSYIQVRKEISQL